MNLSLTIATCYCNLQKNIICHADEIREAINNLKTGSRDYQDWTYAGTNAANRIRARVNAVMNILNSIIRNTSDESPVKRLFSADVKGKLFYPGYICKYCGNQILSLDDCEVDHIVPFDLGGPTEIENAQLLHRWCNRSKGSRMQDEISFEDDSQEDEK